jgi:uncharacterized membrane protein
MKHFAEFLKTTMTGGLLVLFPLVGCVYLFVRVLGFLSSLVEPLLTVLPKGRFIGLAVADLASLIIFVLLSFWIGLLIKTSFGKTLGRGISKLLHFIPGYTLLSRLFQLFFDQEQVTGVPVIVRTGDSRQLGFLMEETVEGEATVYFPSSPTPFSGNVSIVKSDVIERLNVPASDVARIVATFGIGTSGLLKKTGDAPLLDNHH